MASNTNKTVGGLPLVIITFLLSQWAVLANETPREFAKRFYAAHQTWSIRGVPTSEDEGIVSQFVGMEIIHAFRRVNKHRELEAKRYDPDNPMKPRWCIEGEVFCDNWEGVTYYSIGRSKFEGGRWIVEAHLEYVERGKSYPWTDILVLDRAGKDWVVADIRYSRGGTLLTSILQDLDEADREIPKTTANQKLKMRDQPPVDNPLPAPSRRPECR